MAFIEGESLDKRIARGPLKIAEALDVARQITRGLEAAHEKGIFHRDIKPENIIVDSKDHATIMDFGLAQLTEASRLTRADEMMGTVGYMSPEQTEGSGTDHRTDIWSLGVVLYEMVTGQQPFKGDYDKAVVYSILNEEPEPPTALRTGLPMELEVVIGKCLAKDRNERYQRADDLVIDLAGLRKRLQAGRVRQGSPVPDSGRRVSASSGLVWKLVAAGCAALAVVGWALFLSSGTVTESQVRSYSYTPPDLVATGGQGRTAAAISPDGRRIAYVAGSPVPRLWVQELDQDRPRLVEGTEGAADPFWAPDSRTIGYISGLSLSKISIDGLAPVTVCPIPDSPSYSSAAWSADGKTILFVGGGGSVIFRVDAAGGEPKTVLDPGQPCSIACFLPSKNGAQRAVISVGRQLFNAEFQVFDLETGEREPFGVQGRFGAHSPTGHFVCGAEGSGAAPLWALPISTSTFKPTGEPFPIARNGKAPTVSADGTLVFVEAGASTSVQLSWRDRRGNVVGDFGGPWSGAVLSPTLSPDESRVVVALNSGENSDLWILEKSGSAPKRFTNDPGEDGVPEWSPDGRQLTFFSNRSGVFRSYLGEVSGSAPPILLDLGGGDMPLVTDWRSGQPVIYYRITRETGRDVWRADLGPDGSVSGETKILGSPAQMSSKPSSRLTGAGWPTCRTNPALPRSTSAPFPMERPPGECRPTAERNRAGRTMGMSSTTLKNGR